MVYKHLKDTPPDVIKTIKDLQQQAREAATNLAKINDALYGLLEESTIEASNFPIRYGEVITGRDLYSRRTIYISGAPANDIMGFYGTIKGRILRNDEAMSFRQGLNRRLLHAYEWGDSADVRYFDYYTESVLIAADVTIEKDKLIITFHTVGTSQPVTLLLDPRVCSSKGCDLPIRYIRRTQVAGDYCFCAEHARCEHDFGIEDPEQFWVRAWNADINRGNV